jgi:hypothetical protein
MTPNDRDSPQSQIDSSERLATTERMLPNRDSGVSRRSFSV